MAGVRIAHEVTGEGPALLLIHGLGYPRWGWEPIVAPLARSFRVIAFDNRGIGDSDVPPGPYDTATMAADAVSVLDAVGVERAHVVGASLGGMIAQRVALEHPDRLDRLVLACTTPGGPTALPLPAATVALIREATGLAPQEAVRRFTANALSQPPPGLVEELTVRRLARPQPPEAWLAQSAASLGHDVFDRLGEIAAPTLVLHGTADRVVDPRNAALLAERIPAARLELLDDLGHLFFWEDPARTVTLLEEFLSLEGGTDAPAAGAA
ncbi:alpha/beta hydrolase [Actinomadura alba]|uniref:alpha/beta fold hydrolase n=1 Tax=Actinomadura alba TaxID=406431 RepID=UPI0031E45A1B